MMAYKFYSSMLIIAICLFGGGITQAEDDYTLTMTASTAAYTTVGNEWALLPATLPLVPGENTFQIYANGYRTQTVSVMGNRDYVVHVDMPLAPGVTRIATNGLQNLAWIDGTLFYDQWANGEIIWYGYDPDTMESALAVQPTQLASPESQATFDYVDNTWQLNSTSGMFDTRIPSAFIAVTWLNDSDQAIIHDPPTIITYADAPTLKPISTLYPWIERISPQFRFVSIVSDPSLAAVITSDHVLFATDLNGRLQIISDEALYTHADATWLDNHTLRYVDRSGVYDWQLQTQTDVAIIPADLITSYDAQNTLAMHLDDEGAYLAVLRYTLDNQRELLVFDLG